VSTSGNAPSAVEIQAPAKLNLFLEVLGKRDDGYHEIATVMQTVSIFDRVRLSRRPGPGDVTLHCDGPTSAGVPGGPGNLAHRAAELMMAEADCDCGIDIALTKSIPVAAGLGGGSSDAAAVLVGLNTLWDVGLGVPRLEEMAAEIGSDVPFFIRGGTSLCTGRGERVAPLASPHTLHYVVATPELGAETHNVYERVDLPLTANVENVKLIVERVTDPGATSREVASLLFNRLEEPACGLYPGLVLLKERLARLGCEGVLISGSGSCVYGIAAQQDAAREMAHELAKEGGLSGVDVARSLPAGFCERGIKVIN